MSLNWNASKVKGFTNYEENEADVTALSFGLMGVGINAITEANYKKVFNRLYVWERLHGTMRNYSTGASKEFTLAEVKAWIGFSTNVSYLTPTQFLKRLAPDGPTWKEGF